jgi:hypothetical protein
MKRSKIIKKLKRDNRVLKTNIIILSCLIIVMFALFLFLNVWNSDSPRMIIVKSNITTPIEFIHNQENAYGMYSPGHNIMFISLGINKSGLYDCEDRLSTVYHEYAHNIWYKKMTILERMEWGDIYAELNLSKRYILDDYEESEYVRETWAFSFADYLTYKKFYFSDSSDIVDSFERRMFLKYFE